MMTAVSQPASDNVSPSRRRGRRPGKKDSRSDLIKAAEKVFTQKGYDAATTRDIAEEAGIDAAMIRHHFGSKEGLFREVLRMPLDPAVDLAHLRDIGENEAVTALLNTLLTVWDSDNNPLLLRTLRIAVSHDWAAPLVRKVIIEKVVGPLVSRFEPNPIIAKQRVALMVSQLVGLIITRYLLRAEPLASAAHETIIHQIGPTLERYLHGDIDDLSSPQNIH